MSEPSNRSRRHLTAPQWQALFQRFDASTMSVVAFCRQESISESSFYRWRQKLADTPVAPTETAAVTPAFIDAGPLTEPQTASTADPAWDMELDLGGGVVLRLRRG